MEESAVAKQPIAGFSHVEEHPAGVADERECDLLLSDPESGERNQSGEGFEGPAAHRAHLVEARHFSEKLDLGGRLAQVPPVAASQPTVRQVSLELQHWRVPL